MRKIILVALLLMTAACSSKPRDVIKKTNESDRIYTEIYVVNHGWHTGFVVPTEDIVSELPQLKSRFGHAPYIEFGWGDELFYQAREITIGLTLRAALWPTESVVYTEAVTKELDKYFSNVEVEKLCLTKGNYTSLINFILSSFYRTDTGDIVEQKRGLYGESRFYKGVGDYYLTNNCNNWTAKGLKSAGMDIVPTFKFTSDSVMSYLKEYNQSFKDAPVGQAVCR